MVSNRPFWNGAVIAAIETVDIERGDDPHGSRFNVVGATRPRVEGTLQVISESSCAVGKQSSIDSNSICAHLHQVARRCNGGFEKRCSAIRASPRSAILTAEGDGGRCSLRGNPTRFALGDSLVMSKPRGNAGVRCGGPGPGTPVVDYPTLTLVNDSTPRWQGSNATKLTLIKNGTQWIPGSVTATSTTSEGMGQSTYTSTITPAGVVTTIEVGSFVNPPPDTPQSISSTETLDLNTGQYVWCRSINGTPEQK